LPKHLDKFNLRSYEAFYNIVMVCHIDIYIYVLLDLYETDMIIKQYGDKDN